METRNICNSLRQKNVFKSNEWNVGEILLIISIEREKKFENKITRNSKHTRSSHAYLRIFPVQSRDTLIELKKIIIM